MLVKRIASILVLLTLSISVNAEILYKSAHQRDIDFTFISVEKLEKKECSKDTKCRFLLALHKVHDKQQKEEGVQMLKALAASGIQDANHALYEISSWVKADNLSLEGAFSNLKEAAQAGYPESQYELAKAYYKGSLVQKSMEQYHYWIQEAAKQGNEKALFYTANDYYIGRGVAKNEKKGFEWLMTAYDKLGRGFNEWGMLGQAYEEGRGTPVDLAKAYMCFDLMGTAGIEEKARIAPRMTASQRSEGLRLSQEWQQKNHVYAMQSLGLKRQKDGSYQ